MPSLLTEMYLEAEDINLDDELDENEVLGLDAEARNAFLARKDEMAKKRSEADRRKDRKAAKRRKNKPKDMKRSRAAKLGHRRNPTAAKKGAKTRGKFYR